MATYHIDYAGGSNSNSGSKASPWKIHPYMQGGSVIAYTHTPGDRFIFKGGVTWPNSCFPMNVRGNGGNAANRDYYGVDQTWYTGGSWSRPKFDAQGTNMQVGTSSEGFNVMMFGFGNYVTVDNIEFRGLFWSGPRPGDWQIYVKIGEAEFISLLNCKFTDWTHGPYSNGTRNEMFCVVGGGAFNRGSIVRGCEFDGSLTNDSGFGIFGAGIGIIDNYIHHCTTGFNAGQLFVGNHIGPVPVSFVTAAGDSSNHTNAIYSAGSVVDVPTLVIGNKIHDVPGAEVMFMQLGHYFYFNNIFYNVPAGKGVSTSTQSGGGGHHRFYGNTFVTSGTNAIGESAPQTPSLGIIVIQNNLVVSNVGVWNPLLKTASLTNNNNLHMTVAQAATAGYSAATAYAPPTNPGSGINYTSIVNAIPNSVNGIDITEFKARALKDYNGNLRTAWTKGAIEWGGAPSPNQAPTATIVSPIGPITISQGNSLAFTGSATDPNGDTLTYDWNFGTGSGISASTALSPGSKTFNNLGTFTVTFTATDPGALSSSDTVQITVNAAVSNPQISVSGVSDFGFVDVGSTSNLVISVTNSGNGTLTGTATTSAPFSVTGGADYNLAAGQSQDVFVRYSPTTVSAFVDSKPLSFTGGGAYQKGLVGRTPQGLSFPAYSGVITGLTTATDQTYIFQVSEVATPSAGGLAYYEFTVGSAGSFTIRASVDAPGAGNNSFFINVDAEPTSPSMIWDIISFTSGFENRTVSWRGNGTFDAPEFTTQTFALSAGKHRLYVRGREANVKLASITFVSATPPANQPPTCQLAADVTAGTGPLHVSFSLLSADDGDVASGVFNPGDGGATVPFTSPDAIETHPHTYATVLVETIRTATWTVTDNLGATAVASRNITLSPVPPDEPNQAPTAGLTASTLSGNSPLPIDFVLTCNDQDDTIPSGVLNLGDGTSPETITDPAASISRSHTFTNPGPGNITRTVTWQVTDSNDADSEVASVLITISPAPSSAITVTPSPLPFGSVAVGQQKSLTLMVKNTGGGSMTGTAAISAGKFAIVNSPDYTLAPGETYDLFISYMPTAYGATDQATVTFTGGGGTTVISTGTSPAATAPMGTITAPTLDQLITVGSTVDFQGGGTDGGGLALSHLWTFTGSGIANSTVASPGPIQFNTVGSFVVTHRVANSAGIQDPNPPTRTITVVAADTPFQVQAILMVVPNP